MTENSIPRNGTATAQPDDGATADETKYDSVILSYEKAAKKAAGTFQRLDSHHFSSKAAAQIFLANRAGIKTKRTPETVLTDWIAEGGSNPEINQRALDLIPILRAAGAKIENPLAVAEELAAKIIARWNEKNPSPEAEKDTKKNAAREIPSPSLIDERGNPEYEPAQLIALLHPSWPVQNLATHAAHAQRIREQIGGDLCYSPNLGWLVYSGQFWQRDDKHATKASARVAKLTQDVRNEAATLYGFAGTLAQAGRESDAKAMSKAATALLRHTKQVESKAFIEGALHLAAGILAVETEQFDQKPWLIGFQNGTWDKGVWREHRRDDYLLHLSPVTLDFEADRREWDAVLDRITGGDLDLARAAQDVTGYIFSGASHLRKVPWLCGPKGTGKSTVAELGQAVLGQSAATIDPKNLQDSASRERAGVTFWNRKLVVCGEAGNLKLNAELLKTLSGGDQLAVRFLFREAFTAPPRHVILMISNDPPKMDAYDAALKDRVIVLPFVHPLDHGAPLELTGGKRIEAVRQDSQSPLVRGFAAWAIEGLARVWQSQEIHRAACVETATAQFWADTDQLTPFWETVEETELLDGISKTELRKRYETWCETEGARPFNRSLWARACKEGRGLQEEQRTGGKRFWYLPIVAQVA
jgi:putative DNA primase/helicase